MAQTHKLSEEEHKQLLDLNEKYARVYSELGQLVVGMENLKVAMAEAEADKASLIKQQVALMDEETALLRQFKEKYADGELDIQNGTITTTA